MDNEIETNWYIKALEVLRVHITEQIYEDTINTSSILEYIDTAIEDKKKRLAKKKAV